MAGRIVACPRCGERIEQKLVIRRPKLLIVEGRDEEEFFRALLQEMNVSDIQVEGVGGKTFIRDTLRALKDDPFFRRKVASLGITRDANGDARTAFQSIQDALRDAGLPYPRQPLVSVDGRPRVVVMIVPPGRQTGTLEDLCLEAVARDPATRCVDQYFDCLDATELGRPVKDFAKARTRVFLSSRKDPTLALGQAARKGYWPFDTQIFDRVKDFLHSL